MNSRRFVVLDRDGTIIVRRDYLSDPAGMELLPGAARGLRKLAELGLGLVIATNQSGIGRGYFNATRLESIHRRLGELLAAEAVPPIPIYVCPHLPEDGCRCRKPMPGLVEQAARELGFDPRAGFVIGDNVCDVELGKGIGATTLLVRTGYGDDLARAGAVAPDYVVDDLAKGAEVIQHLVGDRMIAASPMERQRRLPRLVRTPRNA